MPDGRTVGSECHFSIPTLTRDPDAPAEVAVEVWLREVAPQAASWRRGIGGSGAVKIGGSPFKTFAEAEEASNAMLKNLTGKS
jgi:hypothetical protein